MAFEKISNDGSEFIVNRTGTNDKDFPVGFEYIMGDLTFKVREIIEKDANTSMRRVILNDGTTEIMTVETLARDMREPGVIIVNDPNAPKEESE